MINSEQIKVVEQRRMTLEQCLNIEQRRIELTNEEEKSQEPNFWDDAEIARKQLQKIASLKSWVVDYDMVAKLCEDLALMPEFVDAGLSSEEEFDQHYNYSRGYRGVGATQYVASRRGSVGCYCRY